MTTDDMVEQALGRLGEFTAVYPSVRGPMYRRIGYRQRQLFAFAAKINPERFGVCATSDLQTVNGSRVIDLSDISGTVPVPEIVQRVEVSNAGTSMLAVGTKVTIVTPEDQAAEDAPRAYLRDRVLIGVGTDLDLVTTLKLYYPRLSPLYTLTDADKVLELEAPWDTLLEVDLAKWLLAKATQLAADVRAAATGVFAEEEKQLLADFEAHVAEYTPAVSRFAAPRVVTRKT